MLSTIVLTAFFAWLILLILVFPIVGWAIHTRKPLPALIAVASLIYSGGIIGYCIKAIT